MKLNSSIDKVTPFVEEEIKVLATKFEPILDEFINELDFSKIDSDQINETKKNLRDFFSDLFYQKESRIRTLVGIEILIENLKILGNKHCLNELRGIGYYILDRLSSQSKEKIINDIEEVNKIFTEISWERTVSSNEKKNTFKSSMPFMDELGISKESFEEMYQIANQLFFDKKIEEAVCVYQFLTVLNSFCPEVWFSMGLCFSKLKKWQEAITSYSTSLCIDATNIAAFLNIIICYKQINDFENARYISDCSKYIVDHSDLSKEDKRKFLNLINDLAGW